MVPVPGTFYIPTVLCNFLQLLPSSFFTNHSTLAIKRITKGLLLSTTTFMLQRVKLHYVLFAIGLFGLVRTSNGLSMNNNKNEPHRRPYRIGVIGGGARWVDFV